MLKRVRSALSGALVKFGHRLINEREAQRPFEMVARRHEAGPFVLHTILRLQETDDHP